MNQRIADLMEMKEEFILNESVFADDHPSWGELADAQAEAKAKWDETDEGKELEALLENCEGFEGQDRDNYTDTQDREFYTVSDD